jgi:hypothetical protein
MANFFWPPKNSQLIEGQSIISIFVLYLHPDRRNFLACGVVLVVPSLGPQHAYQARNSKTASDSYPVSNSFGGTAVW